MHTAPSCMSVKCFLLSGNDTHQTNMRLSFLVTRNHIPVCEQPCPPQQEVQFIVEQVLIVSCVSMGTHCDEGF